MKLDNSYGIPQRNNSYDKIISRLGKYPPMTKEEEFEMFERYKAGDESVLEQIVLRNMRFAILMTKTHQKRGGIPPEDLVSAAYMGILKAATMYDHTVGNKFMSYAVNWINNYIINAKHKWNNRIHIPANIIGKANRVYDIYNKQLLHGYAVESEMSDVLSKMIPHINLTLDVTFENGNPMENNLSPLDETDPYPKHEYLKIYINSMEEKDKYILTRYFGIDLDREYTLEEIGIELNLSRERVRQLKDKALWKLRRKLQPYKDRGELI